MIQTAMWVVTLEHCILPTTTIEQKNIVFIGVRFYFSILFTGLTTYFND